MTVEVGGELSPVGMNPATPKSHANQGFEGQVFKPYVWQIS